MLFDRCRRVLRSFILLHGGNFRVLQIHFFLLLLKSTFIELYAFLLSNHDQKCFEYHKNMLKIFGFWWFFFFLTLKEIPCQWHSVTLCSYRMRCLLSATSVGRLVNEPNKNTPTSTGFSATKQPARPRPRRHAAYCLLSSLPLTERRLELIRCINTFYTIKLLSDHTSCFREI